MGLKPFKPNIKPTEELDAGELEVAEGLNGRKNSSFIPEKSLFEDLQVVSYVSDIVVPVKKEEPEEREELQSPLWSLSSDDLNQTSGVEDLDVVEDLEVIEEVEEIEEVSPPINIWQPPMESTQSVDDVEEEYLDKPDRQIFDITPVVKYFEEFAGSTTKLVENLVREPFDIEVIRKLMQPKVVREPFNVGVLIQQLKTNSVEQVAKEETVRPVREPFDITTVIENLHQGVEAEQREKEPPEESINVTHKVRPVRQSFNIQGVVEYLEANAVVPEVVEAVEAVTQPLREPFDIVSVQTILQKQSVAVVPEVQTNKAEEQINKTHEEIYKIEDSSFRPVSVEGENTTQINKSEVETTAVLQEKEEKDKNINTSETVLEKTKQEESDDTVYEKGMTVLEFLKANPTKRVEQEVLKHFTRAELASAIKHGTIFRKKNKLII